MKKVSIKQVDGKVNIALLGFDGGCVSIDSELAKEIATGIEMVADGQCISVEFPVDEEPKEVHKIHDITLDIIKQVAEAKGWKTEYDKTNPIPEEVGVQMSPLVWTWFGLFGSVGNIPPYYMVSHKYSQRTGKKQAGFTVRYKSEERIRNEFAKLQKKAS